MPTTKRAGQFIKQLTGYRAFIPAPLPPDPPLELDPQLLRLLSRADQALGRLDGLTRTLPDPDLFVAMYVRNEAVYSSQIEGTQSTLDDVLEFELDETGRALPRDVEEVVNYVHAMNHGLRRLESMPLSLRLIREIHAQLMQGVRGAEKSPGEFRTSQNWIGPAGASLSQASYVPPPVIEMHRALDNLERFVREQDALPTLIICGLAHAQFETIHPFLDGNGRVGRLLITFLLCYHNVLHRPLLYLSYFLKRNRQEYYDRLMAIRLNGDWEGWLRFFLRGIAETSDNAARTAGAILQLRERHRALLQARQSGMNSLKLLDLLFERPVVNVNLVRDSLDVSYPTANKLIEQFSELGLLEEFTGAQRYRRYRYTPYLVLFTDEEAREEEEVPIQTTESAP